jgi:FtsZ-interacting cell division protein ZipA
MIVLIVVGALIVVALVVAGWYDHRAKKRGWHVGISRQEVFQHRMDVESMDKNPIALGGEQKSWMTWRMVNYHASDSNRQRERTLQAGGKTGFGRDRCAPGGPYRDAVSIAGHSAEIGSRLS